MPYSGGNSVGGGENYNHFGGIRLRVVGSGVLRPKFYGLDSLKTSTLATITMASSPGTEPFKLANFTNQRARLELKTTGINENAKFNRIVVYIKPIWTGAPNNG